MMDPRICIVGAGECPSATVYPYIGLAGAELAGVCDINRDKAETNSRRFGGTAYQDWEKMLAAERPDGIIICADEQTRASLAVAAMRKGVSVLVDTPPATSSSEALEMVRVSRETGVLCATAFRKRYSTAYTKAKQWIGSFPEGDLYSISLDRSGGEINNGSSMYNLLADLDLLSYLFGDSAKVYALSKGRDAYVVSLKFANGAVGTLNASNGRTQELPIEEMEISIRGSNGMTVHNSSSWRIIRGEKCTEWREPPTPVAPQGSDDTGHLTQLVDFIEAIRDGKTTRSNIVESYKSMVLYEATMAAAELEAAVDVHYELT